MKDSRYSLRENKLIKAGNSKQTPSQLAYNSQRSAEKVSRLRSASTQSLLRQQLMNQYYTQRKQNGQKESSIQEFLHKMTLKLTQSQYDKLISYICTQAFKDIISSNKSNVPMALQNLFKDLLGIQLSTEEINELVEAQKQTIQNEKKSPIRARNFGVQQQLSQNKQLNMLKSYQELPNVTYSNFYNNGSVDGRVFSPSVHSRASDRTSKSTVFSKAFTAVSYVSSTTLGTSLTQKLEGLNRVTIKSLAKQFIQCQQQIQSTLHQSNLTLKSMLTITELIYYLQGTDLNLTLNQLQSVLVAVLYIQCKQDTLLNFKSIIKACKIYLEQSDLEQKDFFNRSKLERYLDEIRDCVYQKNINLKAMFTKMTESNGATQDKVIMVSEQFQQFVKQLLGDKFSIKELEQVYRNIVNKKSLTLKQFCKLFTFTAISEEWFNVGVKQIRDYIIKKKLTSQYAFERLLKLAGTTEKGFLNQQQFREVLKRESLPFNYLQSDYLFYKFDTTQEGVIDIGKWKEQISDNYLNPLQQIREVVSEYDISAEDLLHKIKRKITDDSLNFNQFKECITQIDNSLTQLQQKSLFDLLKNIEGKVEVQNLINNITGSYCTTVDYKKETERRLSQYFNQNNLIDSLRNKLEHVDVENQGKILPEQLLVVLKSFKIQIPQCDLEKYLRLLDKDRKERISIQTFINSIENSKNNNPLKALGMRLIVFLKQNSLTSQRLIDKLIQTKRLSKNNNHGKHSNDISVKYFTKFISTKIDKKLSYEELLSLTNQIDMDKDGIISAVDLESFLQRINFNDFFAQSLRTSASSSKTQSKSLGRSTAISYVHSDFSQPKLFPCEKPQKDKLRQIIKQVKQDIEEKGMSLKAVFKIIDIDSSGLVSFGAFSEQFDQVSLISNSLKERLFAQMDKLNVGLVSFEQFKDTLDNINQANQNENIKDSFQWEENMVKRILDWIQTQNYSAGEGFKVMDQNFDGLVDINDLKLFLVNVMSISEEELVQTKLERLFTLLDSSKTGKIFQMDFEKFISNLDKVNLLASSSLTTPLSRQRYSQSQIRGSNHQNSKKGFREMNLNIDWKKGAIVQISKFIHENYESLEQAFEDAIDLEMDSKLKFNRFQSFLAKGNVLKGYNLTQNLMHELFAFIDPHKKGYLSLDDWNGILGNIDSLMPSIQDIMKLIAASFDTKEEALQVISKANDISERDEKSLNMKGFQIFINKLVPSRYNNYQIAKVFKEIQKKLKSHGHDILLRDLESLLDSLQFKKALDFQQTLNKQLAKTLMGRSSFQVKPYRIESSYSNLSNLYNERGLADTLRSSGVNSAVTNSIQNNLLLSRIKKTLQVKSISAHQLFNFQDTVNNIEYTNIMKKLGISSKEIEIMLSFAKVNDNGLIQVNEFVQSLQKDEQKINENQMTKYSNEYVYLDKRNGKGIEQLKKLMNEYMTSPEDAFQYFDKEKKGKLTYSDFQSLLVEIYQISNQNLPSYSVIKDLFDQIDIRKDSIIDFNEWSKTFSQAEPIVSSLSGQSGSIIWNLTQEYSQVIGFLSKNKKGIEVAFSKDASPKIGIIGMEQGLKILSTFLVQNHQIDLEDWKIRQIVKPFQSMINGEVLLNYQDLLNTIKTRYAFTDGFPLKNNQF